MFGFSRLAANLHSGINLAYNKEEMNEKILNGPFSRPCCLLYRNLDNLGFNVGDHGVQTCLSAVVRSRE